MVTRAGREENQRAGGLPITPRVFHALLCLFHTLPLGVIGLLGRSALALLLVPVCAWAAWWASRTIDLPARLPGFLLGFYAYGAAGFWLAFGYIFEYPFSHTLFYLHLLFVATAWLASRVPWAETWVPRFVSLLLVGFASAVATLPFGRAGGIVALATLTFLLWREREACRRAWSHLGATALLPAVSAFFAFVFSFALQAAPRPGLAREVTRQEGVEALTLTGRLPSTQPRLTLVTESCRADGLIAGFSPAIFPSRLTLIHRATGTGEITISPKIKDPSANAAMDCSRGTLYVGQGDPPAVLAFHDDNVKEPWHTIPLSGGRPKLLFPAEDASLLAAVDGDGQAHVLDLSSNRELSGAEDRAGPCVRRSATGWRPSNLLGPAPTCAYDPRTGSVWMADFERGILQRWEHPAGTRSLPLHLERGIRVVLLDPVSRRLAVGNYLTGHVTLIQADTASVLRTFWTGPRIEALAFSHDHDRLYATSAAGLLEISLRGTRGD
ncbi:MAG: hypothetical protein HYY13_09750 [Nitrospirae bacterium]|nr:hypothetical protein [Nitrospirota bacterium]